MAKIFRVKRRTSNDIELNIFVWDTFTSYVRIKIRLVCVSLINRKPLINGNRSRVLRNSLISSNRNNKDHHTRLFHDKLFRSKSITPKIFNSISFYVCHFTLKILAVSSHLQVTSPNTRNFKLKNESWSSIFLRLPRLRVDFRNVLSVFRFYAS